MPRRRSPTSVVGGGIMVAYSDSEDDDDDAVFVIPPSSFPPTSAKSVDEAQMLYFKYLCEYQLDEDLDSRVKASEVCGKFRVSNNGSCPKCGSSSCVFVILDFLFLEGDMPELLQYLITQGKAVLWSSQDATSCKDPPTFLCRGKCPSDPNLCGFNLDWTKSDLGKIFLFPEHNYKALTKPIKIQLGKANVDPKKISAAAAATGSTKSMEIIEVHDAVADGPGDEPENHDSSVNDSDLLSDEEVYDEGEVDIGYYRSKVSWVVLDELVCDFYQIPRQEQDMIRTMMALEEARADFISGSMHKKVLGPPPLPPDDAPSAALPPSPKIEPVSCPAAGVVATLPLVSISSGSAAALDLLKSKANGAFSSTGASAIPSVLDVKASAINSMAGSRQGATYYGEKNEKDPKPAFTAADFPISKTGACPYCHASDVVYIILVEEENEEDPLPELLSKLEKEGKAIKMKKGEYDLPSFQCRRCTYGFNLDWACANLEGIFYSTSVVTAATQGAYPVVAFSNSYSSMSSSGSVAYVNPFPLVQPAMQAVGVISGSGTALLGQFQPSPWAPFMAPPFFVGGPLLPLGLPSLPIGLSTVQMGVAPNLTMQQVTGHQVYGGYAYPSYNPSVAHAVPVQMRISGPAIAPVLPAQSAPVHRVRTLRPIPSEIPEAIWLGSQEVDQPMIDTGSNSELPEESLSAPTTDHAEDTSQASEYKPDFPSLDQGLALDKTIVAPTDFAMDGDSGLCGEPLAAEGQAVPGLLTLESTSQSEAALSELPDESVHNHACSSSVAMESEFANLTELCSEPCVASGAVGAAFSVETDSRSVPSAAVEFVEKSCELESSCFENGTVADLHNAGAVGSSSSIVYSPNTSADIGFRDNSTYLNEDSFVDNTLSTRSRRYAPRATISCRTVSGRGSSSPKGIKSVVGQDESFVEPESKAAKIEETLENHGGAAADIFETEESGNTVFCLPDACVMETEDKNEEVTRSVHSSARGRGKAQAGGQTRKSGRLKRK